MDVGVKGTLVCYWLDCKLVQRLWKIIRNTLKKVKIELPCDQFNFWEYIQTIKTLTENEICTPFPMFIARLFTIAKTRKHPQCPLLDEWIKMWCIYAMEYYSAIKRTRKSYCFVAPWIDLEGILLSEECQIHKDKCYMISLIILKKPNKQKPKLIEKEIRLVVTRGEGEGVGMGGGRSKVTTLQL